MPFEHVTAFDDERADEGYHGLVQDVEGGYTRSVVLIVPEGHAWLLPVYELALMTAERAVEHGGGGPGHQHRHARVGAAGGARRGGERGGRGAARARACARVPERPPARCPPPAGCWSGPTAPSWRPSRVVALPRIEGRPLRNVPSDENGFIPVDEFAAGAGDGRARLRRRGRHQPAAQARRPGGAAGRRGRRRHSGDGRSGRDARAAAPGRPRRASHGHASRSTSRLASRTAAWSRRSAPSAPGPPTRRSRRRSLAPFLRSLD